jgi:hypothetical protein
MWYRRVTFSMRGFFVLQKWSSGNKNSRRKDPYAEKRLL